jgi:hypothetical protein
MPVLLILLAICLGPIAALAIAWTIRDEMEYRWRNRKYRRRPWWYGA